MAKRKASHMAQKELKLARERRDHASAMRTQDAWTLAWTPPTIASKAAAHDEAMRLCEGVTITPCEPSTKKPGNSYSVMGKNKRTADKRSFGNGKRLGSSIVWANMGSQSILLRRV